MSDLDDVFVEDDPDEKLLGSILKGNVQIPEATADIRPGENFEELNTTQRIVCALAGVRAMEMRGLREKKEIGPTALGKISPIPEGTIKTNISDISVVEKTEKGKYYLPGYELNRAKNIIEGK